MDEESDGVEGLSVLVLAGGKSSRMGTNKAFLRYKGDYFISRIVEKMTRISNDVIVVIGQKQRDDFESALRDYCVRVVRDEFCVENPMGGMLTGFKRVRNPYAAVLACDSPLVVPEVVALLFGLADGHDAAVPIWEDNRTEPLIAVYNAKTTLPAGLAALKEGRIGPKRLVSSLGDVRYVQVEELRPKDPELMSLLNLNTRADLERLGSLSSPVGGAASILSEPKPASLVI